MLAISPFLVSHFNMEKESISAEILEPEVEKQVKRRVLPAPPPKVLKVSEAEALTASPASPTYAPEMSVPKAPIYANVVLDIVTHADIPQTDAPSPISNASFGEDGTLAGPVVIERHQGSEVSGPDRDGYGTGKNFAHGARAVDVELVTSDGIDAGLGIFDTDVVAGHGLIGQVYVLGSPIFRMPDSFDLLTPIYTFVTPNLDIPKRDYTDGFPTPEMQSVIEHFAIRFRGELAIDAPGQYLFGLYSDDGSKLYIDGTLVVDNDGIHSAIGKQGSIKLSRGIHFVEIQYFQGPRHELALRWFYQPPNADRQIVPTEVIYLPDKSRTAPALKKAQQRIKNVEGIETQ